MLQIPPQAPPLDGKPGRFIDDYLLYLMARASHLISGEFHQELRRRGVSVPVWRVLASLVGSAGGETVTGLAEVCLLQQPTMTKLLDRMERDGLVRRAPDGRDRRVVRVELTRTGQVMALDLAKAAKQHEATLLVRHPEAEQAALKDLLRAMMSRHIKAPRRARGAAVAGGGAGAVATPAAAALPVRDGVG